MSDSDILIFILCNILGAVVGRLLADLILLSDKDVIKLTKEGVVWVLKAVIPNFGYRRYRR